MMMRALAACFALCTAAAAYAASEGIHIPEPGDTAMFALAVAALVIGRQASKHPPSAK